MIFAGVDAGSRMIKIILWDSEKNDIIGQALADQGVEQETLAGELFEQLLSKHASGQRPKTVATGYGRQLIGFADTTITEITCHARGVRQLVPNVGTVIDIGGQDSKVIRLNDRGAVRDFDMNDRCAAGTGRFLEVVAERLNVGLDELGSLTKAAESVVSISTMCVVFAETEIVGLLASGAKREDIVAGVQTSIARRVAGMIGRQVRTPICLTGGVALVPGMIEAFESVLDKPVTMAPNPQFTGALGAALLAAKSAND